MPSKSAIFVATPSDRHRRNKTSFSISPSSVKLGFVATLFFFFGIISSNWLTSLYPFSEESLPQKIVSEDSKRIPDFTDCKTEKVVEGTNINNKDEKTSLSDDQISLTIFCAPKPFQEGDGQKDKQLQALVSWLRLGSSIKIVLLGNSSLSSMVSQFPDRVTLESDVDYNFLGTPMFHSLIARARAAETKYSLFINADIILLTDFLSALRKVADRFPNFILTAMRWDVDSMPFYFHETTHKLLSENGREVEEGEVRRHIKEKGRLHTYGGVDFWAWNNGPVPFFEVPMPPFTFGRGRYDNWFTHEMADSKYRSVVDASDAITSVHLVHSYRHLLSQDAELLRKFLDHQ